MKKERKPIMERKRKMKITTYKKSSINDYQSNSQ